VVSRGYDRYFVEIKSANPDGNFRKSAQVISAKRLVCKIWLTEFSQKFLGLFLLCVIITAAGSLFSIVGQLPHKM
jgi:hypothetical protein